MNRPDDVRPAELGLARLLWVFAILSVLVLGALAVAPARARFTEWRAVQNRYNRLARRAGVAPVAVSIKQIW